MRRRRAIATAAATVLICVGAGITPAFADDPIASTSQLAADFSGTSSGPGAGVTIPVTLTAGSNAIEDATLSLDLRHIVLQESDLVSTWLSGGAAAPDWGGDLHVDTFTVPDIDTDTDTTIRLKATGAQLSLDDLGQLRGFVPFSVTARYSDGSTQTVLGALPWNLTGEVGATRIIVPIKAPATAAELYTDAELTKWTSPGGVLTNLASSVAGVPVILAIDPKLVSSIATLDDDSPPARWLAELMARHSVVPSLFGAADGPTLASAGLTSLPQPEASVSDWAGADTVWSSGTSLTKDAVELYSQSNFSAITMPSSRIKKMSWSQNYSIKDMSVIVTDSDLTAAMTLAVQDGGVAIDAALALRALSTSATVDRLVVLNPDWFTPESHLRDLVAAFTSTTWATVSTAIPSAQTESTRVAKLVGRAVSPLDASILTPLVTTTKQGNAIANLVDGDGGSTLDTTLSRTLLSLASTDWDSNPAEWANAVTTATNSADVVASAVYLAPQASVRLASNESILPIPVVNNLQYPVTVGVTVHTSSGRLVITEAAPITIDAKTTAQIYVPVKAVANGNVTLSMQLEDTHGNALGASVSRKMTVSAEWESITAIALASVVALLFGFGLFRGIRRKRSGAEIAVSETETGSADGSAPSTMRNMEPSDPRHEPQPGSEPQPEPTPNRAKHTGPHRSSPPRAD